MRRLDAVLVSRGLARSRGRAAELIRAGRVRVAGHPARKPSQSVVEPEQVELVDPEPDYVSRGAYKLMGALDAIDVLYPGALPVAGARCLDAGAAAGGFTQVLLERGAAQVFAVDVGHGQLDPELATDPRVSAWEGYNVRELSPAVVGQGVDLLVADLSFISLTLVMESLGSLIHADGSLVVLVKPQFEVGRGRVGTGVVTSPALRATALLDVIEAAVRCGLGVRAVVPSPLPGPSGNQEYFLWLVPDRAATADLAEAAQQAVDSGAPIAVPGRLPNRSDRERP